MTGFGSASAETNRFSISIQIKALNSKFFECSIKLPKNLIFKEIDYRNFLSSRLVRGSVYVLVNLEPKLESNEIELFDSSKFKSYYKKYVQVASELDAPRDDIFRIVSQLPEVNAEHSLTEESEEILLLNELLDTALEQVLEFRKNEAKAIVIDLLDSCQRIENLINPIEQFEDERKKIMRARLENSINELNFNDEQTQNRLEQELIFYIEKFDINEEKSRLRKHCQHFKECINAKPYGKTLNFVAQEMGREINTLGSKANFAEIQHLVVQMKEELEKIKEQTLNIV